MVSFARRLHKSATFFIPRDVQHIWHATYGAVLNVALVTPCRWIERHLDLLAAAVAYVGCSFVHGGKGEAPAGQSRGLLKPLPGKEGLGHIVGLVANTRTVLR